MGKANGHASLPAAEQPEDTIKAVGGLVAVTAVDSPAQQVQLAVRWQRHLTILSCSESPAG